MTTYEVGVMLVGFFMTWFGGWLVGKYYDERLGIGFAGLCIVIVGFSIFLWAIIYLLHPYYSRPWLEYIK